MGIVHIQSPSLSKENPNQNKTLKRRKTNSCDALDKCRQSEAFGEASGVRNMCDFVNYKS